MAFNTHLKSQSTVHLWSDAYTHIEEMRFHFSKNCCQKMRHKYVLLFYYIERMGRADHILANQPKWRAKKKSTWTRPSVLSQICWLLIPFAARISFRFSHFVSVCSSVLVFVVFLSVRFSVNASSSNYRFKHFDCVLFPFTVCSWYHTWNYK